MEPKKSLEGSKGIELTNLGAKARILEDRYDLLRKKIEVIENNLIDLEKTYKEEIRAIDEDLLEIKRSIEELREKIIQIASELVNAATVRDYRELKAYLSIMNPYKWEVKE